MHFHNAVSDLMTRYGFTRKVATLIVRIQMGVDTLEGLTSTTPSLVGMSEYITIEQYLESVGHSPKRESEQVKSAHGVDYFNPDPAIVGNM